MLSVNEVKALPVGKGIRVINIATGKSYNALVTAPMTGIDREIRLRLMTENGQLSRPTYEKIRHYLGRGRGQLRPANNYTGNIRPTRRNNQ